MAEIDPTTDNETQVQTSDPIMDVPAPDIGTGTGDSTNVDTTNPFYIELESLVKSYDEANEDVRSIRLLNMLYGINALAKLYRFDNDIVKSVIGSRVNGIFNNFDTSILCKLTKDWEYEEDKVAITILFEIMNNAYRGDYIIYSMINLNQFDLVKDLSDKYKELGQNLALNIVN